MANNVERDFKKRLRLAEIKPNGNRLIIQTLRASCCKNWLDSGLNPGVVQKLMGHSSLNTTIKFYHKVNEADEKKAAQAVDKLLKTRRKKADRKKLATK